MGFPYSGDAKPHVSSVSFDDLADMVRRMDEQAVPEDERVFVMSPRQAAEFSKEVMKIQRDAQHPPPNCGSLPSSGYWGTFMGVKIVVQKERPLAIPG